MFVDELMVQYAEALCTASRTDPRVHAGLGPEQAAQLIEAAKAIATAHDRSYVTPPDIKSAFRAYPQVEPVADDIAAMIAQRLALTEIPKQPKQ